MMKTITKTRMMIIPVVEAPTFLPFLLSFEDNGGNHQTMRKYGIQLNCTAQFDDDNYQWMLHLLLPRIIWRYSENEIFPMRSQFPHWIPQINLLEDSIKKSYSQTINNFPY